MGNAGSAPEQAKHAVDGAEAEACRAPPSTVRFVPVAAGNQARQPPPIKLEEDEGAPPPPAAEEDMAPRNIWQVRHAVDTFCPETVVAMPRRFLGFEGDNVASSSYYFLPQYYLVNHHCLPISMLWK
jgi:hypothetical protein